MKAFIRKATRSRLKKLETEIKRAARTPEDPDAAHKLRVAIRRYTQCLRTFKQFFDREQGKKIRRRLRKLLDRCGEARNCDVAIDVLAEAGFRDARMVARFKQRRAEAEKDLDTLLDRWVKKDLFKGAPVSVGRQGSGMWELRASADENARRVLPTIAAELWETGDTAQRPEATYHELHAFRLSAKRFRYTLELFAEVYGAELETCVGLLKGLQDRLGAMNDCVATLALVKGNRSASAALKKLLRGRDEEFRRYWIEEFAPEKRGLWTATLGPKAELGT